MYSWILIILVEMAVPFFCINEVKKCTVPQMFREVSQNNSSILNFIFNGAVKFGLEIRSVEFASELLYSIS